MTTVYDVPPDLFIEKLADHLKSEKSIAPPEWAENVRTGIHTEKEPVQEDWWFIRTAAVLRKIYMKGPLGTDRLKEMFGGYRNRGSKPNRAVAGSGAIIRNALKQLDEAGLTEKAAGKGRKVTDKGISLCNKAAHEVMAKIAVENPELTKY